MSVQENEEEYTNSEGEELGVWYDLPFVTQNVTGDKETAEPFSLDLDIQPEDLPEVLQAVQEEQEADKEETRPDMVEHSDLQDISMTQTDETRRPQRLRKAPSRLTYDTPGSPSIVFPTVKYVSCFYKWISSPFIT